MKSMTIYFVAGEVSADNHGASVDAIAARVGS